MLEAPGKAPSALALAALLAAAAVVGCKGRSLDRVGEPDNPLVLVAAPTHAGTPEGRSALEAFVRSHAGVTLVVRVAESQEGAMLSAGGRGAHAWVMPLFDYLFAHKEYGIRARLQVLRGEGSRTFAGEILVRADAGMSALGDLEGKRMAFVDAHSTSGFLFAAEALRRAGVEVDGWFAGSHEAALAALRAGRVDAAATYAGAAGDDPSVVPLTRTADIPNEPIAFHSDLPSEVAERVVVALTAFAATEEGRRALAGMAAITGFAPVEDAAYQPARAAIRAAGKSSADLVPGGWRIYNQNRRIPGDYFP